MAASAPARRTAPRFAQAGAVPRFSRLANSYVNAPANWSTLKTGLLPGGSPCASLEEARLVLAHYPDTCFNLDRLRSALGHRPPHQFERDLRSIPLLAHCPFCPFIPPPPVGHCWC